MSDNTSEEVPVQDVPSVPVINGTESMEHSADLIGEIARIRKSLQGIFIVAIVVGSVMVGTVLLGIGFRAVHHRGDDGRPSVPLQQRDFNFRR